MIAKSENIMDYGGVTITCLGPSTVQGCFEVFREENNNVDTVFDQENAFCAYLKKIFSMLYLKVPLNIINARINGEGAEHGLARLSCS